MSIDAEHAVLECGDVLVYYFPRRITHECLRKIAAAFADALPRHPNGVTSFALIRPGIPIPTPDVRKEAARLVEWIVPHTRAQCLILDGNAMWVSMADAALGLIHRATIDRFPRGVFRDVESAVRWHERHGATERDDPSLLRSACAELVRAHEALRS